MTAFSDISRYTVAKYLYSTVSVCFIIIAATNYFGQIMFFYQASGAFLISFVSLIYIHKTKKFKGPIILTIFLSFFEHIIGFITESPDNHQTDLFWIINISIFVFYTLGQKYAIFYLTINMMSLFSIKAMLQMDVIQYIPKVETDTFTILTYYLNMLFSLFVFIYLIKIILREISLSESQLLSKNEKLKSKDEEKTLMLKEIHHRVKNNLQVVTSLLRLQLYKIEDQTAAEPFQESIDRIASMALIHEKMYQGDKVKAINIKDYIKDLAENLIRNYANDKPIILDVDSTVKTIELNHIVPLSLILNELISNSLKHAFQDKHNGHISINISTNEVINLQLCYKDSGDWKVPKDNTSFGLELIDTFTEQLNGEYKFKSEEGADYSFNFNDILSKN